MEVDSESSGAGALDVAEAAGADAVEAVAETHFDDGPLVDDMKVVVAADGDGAESMIVTFILVMVHCTNLCSWGVG